MINFKKYIRVPYYYVPPCPSCGSRMTGRFVRYHRTDETDWMIYESLRHGELIEPQPEILADNAFCVECGYTWPAYIQLKFFTLSRIADEKEDRCTNKLLKDWIDTKRKEAKPKKKGILGAVRRFIGKL